MNNNTITFTIDDKAGNKRFKVTTDAEYEVASLLCCTRDEIKKRNIVFYILADDEKQAHERLAAGAVYKYLTNNGIDHCSTNHDIVRVLFASNYTLEEAKETS